MEKIELQLPVKVAAILLLLIFTSEKVNLKGSLNV